MLLTKHKDWEQENESRLWIIGSPPGDLLSIDRCIEAICLGKRFLEKKEMILELIDIILNPNYIYRDIITKDVFGLIVSDDTREAWPIRPNIDSAISPIIYNLSKFRDI